jgi:hypothetical protein
MRMTVSMAQQATVSSAPTTPNGSGIVFQLASCCGSATSRYRPPAV